MSNADLIERLNDYISNTEDCLLRKMAADALAAADKRIAELERNDGGGCTLSGPGRGDCAHFVGLPGESIPGQHDGDDDTVDAYGKPNGWCWSCWKSKRVAELEAERDAWEHEFKAAYKRETEAERKLAVAREALKSAYNTATDHDDREPFDWAVYCEMLYQTLAQIGEK